MGCHWLALNERVLLGPGGERIRELGEPRRGGISGFVWVRDLKGAAGGGGTLGTGDPSREKDCL
jgi:hypothetical protein